MNRIPLSLPEIGLISGTRAAAGAGLALLLLADRLSGEQRRAVGWTLLAVGIISTIPIVAGLRSSRYESSEKRPMSRNPARYAREEQYA